MKMLIVRVNEKMPLRQQVTLQVLGTAKLITVAVTQDMLRKLTVGQVLTLTGVLK